MGIMPNIFCMRIKGISLFMSHAVHSKGWLHFFGKQLSATLFFYENCKSRTRPTQPMHKIQRKEYRTQYIICAFKTSNAFISEEVNDWKEETFLVNKFLIRRSCRSDMLISNVKRMIHNFQSISIFPENPKITNILDNYTVGNSTRGWDYY